MAKANARNYNCNRNPHNMQTVSSRNYYQGISVSKKKLKSRPMNIQPMKIMLDTKKQMAPTIRFVLSGFIQYVMNPQSLSIGFYSLVNVALIFVVIQATRSVVEHTFYLPQLISVHQQLAVSNTQSTTHNSLLNQKINWYQSPQGIEELARNTLNLVNENEFLVKLQ
ncbi:MAG: hypothetical protein AAGI66_07385 [Cyanobacteria bacterium P01_H01_bin.74]